MDGIKTFFINILIRILTFREKNDYCLLLYIIQIKQQSHIICSSGTLSKIQSYRISEMQGTFSDIGVGNHNL